MERLNEHAIHEPTSHRFNTGNWVLIPVSKTEVISHRNEMVIHGIQGLKEWTGLSPPDVCDVKGKRATYYVRGVWD